MCRFSFVHLDSKYSVLFFLLSFFLSYTQRPGKPIIGKKGLVNGNNIFCITSHHHAIIKLLISYYLTFLMENASNIYSRLFSSASTSSVVGNSVCQSGLGLFNFQIHMQSLKIS